MREEAGSIWDYPADAIVIPVNWTTKRNGDAVMGAGVAKQAAERWRGLPMLLGHWIEKAGPHVFWDRPSGEPYIVCFPTKRDWRQPSDVQLIEDGARQLATFGEYEGWKTIALPRLGCGLGGLDWPDVRPVLAKHLDDRFVVVHPEEVAG